MTDGLMPGVVHRLTLVNHRVGGMRRPIMGQVEHHIVGSDTTAEAIFNDPATQKSAHFIVKLDGEIIQVVSINDAAFAACMSNWQGWVQIENESPAVDDPSTPDDEVWAPPTPEQIVGNGRILRFLHDTEDVPMQVTDNIGTKGVAYHSMHPGPCSTHWGITGCPGDGFINKRQAMVDAASGAPVPPIPPPEEADTMRLKRYGDTWVQFNVDTNGVLLQSTYDKNLKLIAGAQDQHVLAGNRPSSDVEVEVIADVAVIAVGTEDTQGRNRLIHYEYGKGWFDAQGNKLP